ncbi:MAG TPA: HupE/UreJ family protein [Vicinamibacterales bacterium]|nr:HupE/UreJ family protein [Vicinamibacterales bacterium]
MVNVRFIVGALVAICLASSAPAHGHPIPFSYVDVRLQLNTLEVTLVVPVFDLAHDLGVQPPELLLAPDALRARDDEAIALLRGRLNILADGRAVHGTWSSSEPLPHRQSVRLRARYELARMPGRVDVATAMFPYDPQHQTFLNFYENGSVTAQAILDKDRTVFEYFAGTTQGIWAVLRKFVPSGVHHILIGPDHLLFLVGLLLMGGTIRQVLLMVTAFTIAHSITLSLAALSLVMPPAGLIEPAIALSVIYVGADNLLMRGGRDTRAWIAFAFGLIHGFGFANVLRDMDLPSRALGWTLFGFNLGVEIGQLGVVIVVASALAWIRSRSPVVGTRLAVAGSVVVMLAGAFWFAQRVFFEVNPP